MACALFTATAVPLATDSQFTVAAIVLFLYVTLIGQVLLS